jgi:hypothetical protein
VGRLLDSMLLGGGSRLATKSRDVPFLRVLPLHPPLHPRDRLHKALSTFFSYIFFHPLLRWKQPINHVIKVYSPSTVDFAQTCKGLSPGYCGRIRYTNIRRAGFNVGGYTRETYCCVRNKNIEAIDTNVPKPSKLVSASGKVVLIPWLRGGKKVGVFEKRSARIIQFRAWNTDVDILQSSCQQVAVVGRS